ncbi:cytochrome P450 [Nocardia sp. NPDC050712]|uniref:cytochrome P450 n=1 Tax=Nocardia sp. NPDC050712 TaxID=3155518 RepID=UPI0033C24475
MPTSTITAAPGSIPLLGHALRLHDDPLGFFESMREYGEIVRIRLGSQDAYVLNSPELIREVLVAKAREFSKGTQIEGARDLFGYGLVSSEGATHRRQRLLMQPAFRRDRIAEYARTMRSEIVAQTGGWSDGDAFDIRVEMTTLALSVAAKTMMSSELGDGLVTAMKQSLPRLLELLYRRMINPLPRLNALPLPRNREYARILATLHPMIDAVIADYKRHEVEHDDLLGALLRATDPETGATLSDTEVHDQITAILVAGSETTAATLSWAFHLLTEHPEVEARLHAELDDVLDGRPAEYADVRRLPYTAQIVSETLRHSPPAWLITRRATVDVEVGGYPIPAGGSILISPYAVQRDPALFEEPARFDPDRWSPERVAMIPRNAVLQFSNGPRKCIGDVFAVVEATLALATIAGQWQLRVQPGARFEKVAASTYTPRNLSMAARKRRG